MHKISTRVVCVNGKHPWISVVVSNCNMVMFWDAIASLIGYCEFGQQTWSKFVSQNSHSTDQSLTIICPNSEMCIFCGALLYFCTKNKVVLVVVVCKHNEVSKKCRLLRLTLPPRISSTLFAITPHSFNCTVFIQWPAKTANWMIVQLLISLLTRGRVTKTFFSFSLSVWMLSQNNTTVVTLYFKEHYKILNAAMFLLWM